MWTLFLQTPVILLSHYSRFGGLRAFFSFFSPFLFSLEEST